MKLCGILVLEITGEKYVELDNFMNTNWIVEFHNQTIEQCYENFCEMYKEGVSRWVTKLEEGERGTEKGGMGHQILKG